MSRKGKKLFKNLSLGILGLGILGGAVALGTNYLKNDSVNIHPSYEIGGLTEYGKYVEDEGKLYTKNKFACDGLKVTLDFDNDISYRVFYYDILDNFIEATDTLTDGYSEEAPLNGAYARIEITPLNDEDGKISWMEKYDYSSQLNLSVSKTANNIDSKFVSLNGNLFTVVDNINDSQFKNGFLINENLNFIENNSYSATTETLINVDKKRNLTFEASKISASGVSFAISIIEFTDITNGNLKYELNHLEMSSDGTVSSYEIGKQTKYILINIWCENVENSSVYSSAYQKAFTLN